MKWDDGGHERTAIWYYRETSRIIGLDVPTTLENDFATGKVVLTVERWNGEKRTWTEADPRNFAPMEIKMWLGANPDGC